MEFVGIDKFSILDYEDKIAVVLFAPKCNFRCPFCHNGLTILDNDNYLSFDDILSFLKERKGMVDAVVISGGEPTLLPDLIDKIKQIKQLGYLIKLDTNGTNPDMIKTLHQEGLFDYVAMDIKNSPSLYPLTAGVKHVDLSKINESIQYLMRSGIDYEFRTTLVKEFHNNESIKEMGEFIKGAKKLYLQKFVEREGCIKKGLHEINEDQANEFKNILEQFVNEVLLRGY